MIGGLAACGDDDTSTTTTEASTTTTTTETAESDLSAVVLQIDEVPAGYAGVYTDAGVGAAGDEWCGTDPTDEVPEDDGARASFTQEASGPELVSDVMEYADDSTAEAFMEAATAAVDGCKNYTVPERGTVTISALSFPNVGDDTFAARFSAATTMGSYVGDIVYVRTGNRVMLLVNAGPGGVDSGVTEELTRLVADRM